MRKSYTSDLTDKQWALIEPLIPPARSGGDRRTSNMREVVDGIFYMLKNGYQWRDVPGDFAPDWHTVYAYFSRWRAWIRRSQGIGRPKAALDGRHGGPSRRGCRHAR